ncbi:MAG TPA: SPOR domain-containing protein [Sandaracinaceae bacterium LLY-WYZ-13_1]|nr:SPOR domain-containing protein [Sandaracinaceae bacterium LLY-WYZ-13_1]
MDSAMRDLEQIRERDDEGESRPLALVALLIGVTVALVLALGSLVGWSDEEAVAEDDPLARLDRAAGLSPREPADDEADEELPEVNPSDLTFPEALGPSDERPEVAAALAAATAELEHPDPLEHLPPMEESPEDRVARALPSALPAAVAAGPGSESLARTAARDPMVAGSIPTDAPAEAPAPAGRDGEYTVQVISYDSPEGAESFAAGLRARGHRAFVMSAEVEGRGTMYRVRVGPFETLREAQAYRREFERNERMNTLLVRRRDDSA